MDATPARLMTRTRRPTAVQRVYDLGTRSKIVAAAVLGLLPAAALAAAALTGAAPAPVLVVAVLVVGAVVARGDGPGGDRGAGDGHLHDVDDLGGP